jgi:hypothetical protein
MFHAERLICSSANRTLGFVFIIHHSTFIIHHSTISNHHSAIIIIVA